jgi:hypothetical protein
VIAEIIHLAENGVREVTLLGRTSMATAGPLMTVVWLTWPN